jgi:membrane-associated phospholipid phosphatase
MQSARILFLGLLFAGPLAPAQAQQLQPVQQVPAPSGPSAQPGPSAQWWHGALLVGGVSALMLLDNPVRSFSQSERGSASNGFASGIRHMGQPEVYGTVTLGLLGAGLITGNQRITQAGLHVGGSVALAAGAVYVGKSLLGRSRPDEIGSDGDDFHPLTGRVSMPSGHTALAFCLATSLADDINRPWATVGLYSMAGAVGLSRINDNRHWLTDVVAGAAVGIASAKFISGRWTILGIRAPSFLVGPQGMGVGWHAEF